MSHRSPRQVCFPPVEPVKGKTMPSIEEIIAARKAAKPKTVRVSILMDADASDELSELETQLDAASSNDDERLGAPDNTDEIQGKIDALRETSADAIIVLEFERLPGRMWNELTATNPVRGDSIIDLTYGYNLDAVVEKAAKSRRGGHSFAWLLEDGKPVVITDEQWDDIFSLMSGHDASAVRDAVWNLNEWGPSQALAAAKKALAETENGLN